MMCECLNPEACENCSTKWCNNCYTTFKGLEHQCNPSNVLAAQAIKEQKKLDEERRQEFQRLKMQFKGIKIK